MDARFRLLAFDLDAKTDGARAAAARALAISRTFMAMTKRVRRRRGTPIQGVFYRLDPDVKAQIDDYSERFQVPTWAIVEAAIRSAQPGANGIPEGWDLPGSAQHHDP